MSERILILAPRGRDAEIVEQVLRRDGVECLVCAAIPGLLAGIRAGAGAVLVTEEALWMPGLPPLLEWCRHQPPWSDLPMVVLATRQAGRRPPEAARVLEALGNVVLLERPINAETLTSAVASALRARRRQYQAGDLLVERERSARQLRRLNEALEQRVEERSQEARGARQTLAFALEAAGMGLWEIDVATDTSRRSAQHDIIFGYAEPQGSWTRAQYLQHVLEEDRSLLESAFGVALGTGVLETDYRIRRPDGVVRWITTKGRVEFGPRGEPLRVAGVVMDTTARRETEDALHQAQKMEAIGQLTGGVAHDFNNLLTVIVGGLDMILRRPEQPERIVRLAGAAMTAARRGEQLTHQLLAFSRRQMLRPQTLDPNRLLRDFEALARRAVGEAVTLKLDLDPDVGAVRVDPTQFESAVLNLIVNARDAMPSGGTITVQTHNVQRDTDDGADVEVPPGPHVVIAVSDTGSGLDPQTLARAFEPFFTTKEVGKGSGLGLSQVYGFARSAGGEAAIESAPGQGTTVRIYLPRSAEAVVEGTAAAPGPEPLRAAADGETVLLVDDDAQVLAMAVEGLRELRYRVILARDAREALAQLRGPGRIDVLFSDVVMPGGMNGAELAVEARRIRPDLKVLLTSGYVGELGAGDVVLDENLPILSKPYRRDDLAQKLRAVLEGA